jgi:RNA polymerase sigma-70 factor (ECF subfamily)
MGSDELVSLVASAQRGNCEALATLLASFQATIYKIAIGMVTNHEDALDVRQSVSLLIKRKIGTVKELNRFAGWVRHITVNFCLAYRRRRERSRVDFMDPHSVYRDKPDEAPCPLDSLIRAEECEKVRALVEALSDLDRQILTLRFLDGRELDEIATLLGVPMTTVKPRLHRAKVRLMANLVRCGLGPTSPFGSAA